MMMMDQAHFGEYLLRQQMLHAASLSGLRKFFLCFWFRRALLRMSLYFNV